MALSGIGGPTVMADWRQLSDIVADAIERPPNERRAYLDAACDGDSSLRAEADALLTSYERAGNFLEQPADAPRDLVDATFENLVGRQIGPYHVEGILGEGGMGVVMLATDARLDRRVALKAISPAYAEDPTRRARLTCEAKAAAAVSHPNVATVYALEEIAGQLYIASEYVQGATLRAVAEEGPLAQPELIVAAGQVASALAAAHALGIVHRDLKPENVIRGVDGVLKVVDFGIAHSPTLHEGADRLTAAGAVLGTPAYMSPEQINGSAGDARSDIFAFGALIYELATGVSPFAAPTALAAAARVLGVMPEPLPSSVAPPWMARIISRCLDKEPSRRYGDGAALRQDIESQGIAAMPPARAVGVSTARETNPRARTWWTFHQAAAMIVYATLVSPVWVSTWWNPGLWSRTLLFVMFTAAALNGTLRAHLLFTNRFNDASIAVELRRTRNWVLGSDLLIGADLIAAAMGLLGPHTAVGLTLAAFGIGTGVVAIAVEPATTRTAFRAAT